MQGYRVSGADDAGDRARGTVEDQTSLINGYVREVQICPGESPSAGAVFVNGVDTCDVAGVNRVLVVIADVEFGVVKNKIRATAARQASESDNAVT